MANNAKSLSRTRRGEQGLALFQPPLELQHLWFRVADRKWQSLALVPVEGNVSTLEMAKNIARVAAEQPDSRVLIVNASLRDCRPPRNQPVAGEIVMEGLHASMGDSVSPNCDMIDLGKLHQEDAERALMLAPQLLEYMAAEGKTYSAAIFAVDSVLHQTRAIPLVRSLDAVALCISLGKTTFAEARHAIDIVGRERIAGSVALRG